MTVYIDPPTWPGHDRVWSHLISDVSYDELHAFAERLGSPVLTTFKAKGLVPDSHPLGAGVLGRSGTPWRAG